MFADIFTDQFYLSASSIMYVLISPNIGSLQNILGKHQKFVLINDFCKYKMVEELADFVENKCLS